MEQIFVKPAKPGMKVRKLVNGYLAADGELVNAEGYWLRRIADGDVVGATAFDELVIVVSLDAQPANPRPVKTSAANL